MCSASTRGPPAMAVDHQHSLAPYLAPHRSGKRASIKPAAFEQHAAGIGVQWHNAGDIPDVGIHKLALFGVVLIP